MSRLGNRVAFAAFALLAGSVLYAERAEAQGVEGSWVYVAQGSDDVNAVIEKGTAKMNFVTKPVARKRLKGTNKPYQTLVISRTGSEIVTAMDDRAPIHMPADGKAIKWKREDGEVFNVNAVTQNGALVQSFIADDGQRENAYKVRPDGTLEMKVTIRSGRLPAPLVYTLLYRKEK